MITKLKEQIWFRCVEDPDKAISGDDYVWYSPTNVGVAEEIFEVLNQPTSEGKIQTILEQELEVQKKVITIALGLSAKEIKNKFQTIEFIRVAFTQIYRMNFEFQDEAAKKNYQQIWDRLYVRPVERVGAGVLEILKDPVILEQSTPEQVIGFIWELCRTFVKGFSPDIGPLLSRGSALKPSGKSSPGASSGTVLSTSGKEPEIEKVDIDIDAVNASQQQIKKDMTRFRIVKNGALCEKSDKDFPYDISVSDAYLEQQLKYAEDIISSRKPIEERYQAYMKDPDGLQDFAEGIISQYEQWMEQKENLWTSDRIDAVKSGDAVKARAAAESWLWKWYQQLTGEGVEIDIEMLHLRWRLQNIINQLKPSPTDIQKENKTRNKNKSPLYDIQKEGWAPDWYRKKLKESGVYQDIRGQIIDISTHLNQLIKNPKCYVDWKTVVNE